MNFDAICARAAADGLTVTGWFHPDEAHSAPPTAKTVLLLGYGGGDLWASFTDGPEYTDGEPHALDRWSIRVIGAIAAEVGGEALFPFGGPPYQPFIRWMYASEPLHPSRLGMAIHAERGLWSGWRGALALPISLELPPVKNSAPPCDGCPMPCRTACPVGAFSDDGYDSAACRAHLNSGDGDACRNGGCLARRACPVGGDYAQSGEQAAFHLEAFRRAG